MIDMSGSRRPDGRCPFPASGIQPSGGLRVASLALALLCMGSLEVGHAAGWTFTPTFSATQLITDNRDLTENDKRSEAITVLSPGIRMSRSSGRVTGSLAYTARSAMR